MLVGISTRLGVSTSFPLKPWTAFLSPALSSLSVLIQCLDAKNSERKLGERWVRGDGVLWVLILPALVSPATPSSSSAHCLSCGQTRTSWEKEQNDDGIKQFPPHSRSHCWTQNTCEGRADSRRRESNFSNRSVIFIVGLICVKATAPSSRHVTTAERCETGEQPLRSINKFLSWSFQRETICIQAHVWHENCTKQHKPMCDLFFILACFFCSSLFLCLKDWSNCGSALCKPNFCPLGGTLTTLKFFLYGITFTLLICKAVNANLALG